LASRCLEKPSALASKVKAGGMAEAGSRADHGRL